MLKSSIHYFLSKLSLKIMISFYLKINIFDKKKVKKINYQRKGLVIKEITFLYLFKTVKILLILILNTFNLYL